MYDDIAGVIITFRDGEDGIAGTKDDKVFTTTLQVSEAIPEIIANSLWQTRVKQVAEELFSVKATTFSIVSHATKGKAKKTITTVVKKEAEDDEKEFLYYYED